MFKAANPYDEIVTKATDENLTSENWELNLDVCDKISGQGGSGARDCVAAISKRLLHRSANVQLYALTLSDSLSKNAPASIIYPELSSRSFCQTLVRVVNDRNTHEMVKKKTLMLIKEWMEVMQKEADKDGGNGVGAIMKETYEDLKRQHHRFEEPTDDPVEPSSDQLRAEDEELRRVLELSLQDQGGRQTAASAAYSGLDGRPGASGSSAAAGGGGGSSRGALANSASVPGGASSSPVAASSTVNGYSGTSSSSAATAMPQQNNANAAAGTGQAQLAASRVRALYDFQPTEHGELGFQKGDVIRVLDSVYEHWWRGELRGEAGIFPVNYVEILPDPTPADIQRDAELEARIFSSATAIDMLVDKLRQIDPRKSNLSDDEELQELYQQALSIRPKIVRLIDRYSAKVAELKGLNEKFVKARGRFEGMMEESLQRFEPNRAGQAGREYMGHRQPVQQQQQQQPIASAPGASSAAAGSLAQQQRPQQDYSQQWAAYHAQQGYPQQQQQDNQQQHQYLAQQQAQGMPPPQMAAGSGAGAGAGAVAGSGAPPQVSSSQQVQGTPQPPPGLHPSDPAYAQWYYSHYGNPQQQQQQQYANASLTTPSAGPGASGSSTSLIGEASGSSSSSALPAVGSPSELGQLPQDDEKRRLFEKARAEAEAYQNAHRAYIAQQQQQQQAPQPLQM